MGLAESAESKTTQRALQQGAMPDCQAGKRSLCMRGCLAIRTLTSYICLEFRVTVGERGLFFRGWEVQGHVRFWKDMTKSYLVTELSP